MSRLLTSAGAYTTASKRMPFTSNTTAPSIAAAPTAKPRLERIQICRGVAALLVLLFHTTQLSQAKLGQTFLGNLFAFGGAGVRFFLCAQRFHYFLCASGGYRSARSAQTLSPQAPDSDLSALLANHASDTADLLV